MLLKFGSLALSVIFSFPIISLAQGYKDTFKLKEVVVTGSIKELRREDFAIPVEIYTKDFFYNTNVVNLLDAIRYISGLQANIDGAVDGASDLEINGLEGTYALVMIDGAPITGGVGNLYGLMGIPISMIERIEVIKGPCSTLYGTEALAGVINIITTNPEKASKVFADVRMSSYLETAADFSCRLKEGKAYGLLGLSYYGMNYKWDWNKDNFTDLPVQNRISLLNKWSLRNRYQRQSNFLARYVWENRNGGQMPYNSKWRGSDSIYGEAAKTNRFELLGNIAFPTAKTNLDLMFGFSHHNADAAYGTNIFLHQEQNGYVQLIYDNKITRISDFLLGVAYRFNRYDDNLLTTADTLSGKLLNKPFLNHYPAIFLQDMIHVNEQHEILAGFRLEYNSYFTGVAFAPRFDYKWATKDKTKELRAGIGSGYRTPNAFIDNKYAFTSGRRIVLDEALKTETCYGLYTDFIHKINSSRANIFWETRLFYNFLFNMVEMETDFSNNLITYKNEDSYGMNFGINTMVDVTFNFPLKINLGINLLG
ncbi:MAG: TonB-dependent receptor plug domain-containing protein, partial [Chitinophagales bacterium]|nr:TonB-dependent receptor plug domain-containing protein [Chitinophagales bacterium]